jgi:hypothetical protein
MHESINSIKFASDIELMGLIVEISDRGMLFIASKYFLCFLLSIFLLIVGILHRLDVLVRLVNILNCDDSKISIISEISQGNASPSFDSELINAGLGNIQSNWHTKNITID